MDTAISTFTLLPSTKDQISVYVDSVKKSILSGNESTLKIWRQIKAFEKVIEQITEDEEIKKAVVKETETFGDKTFDTYGCKFQLRGNTSYNYTFCGDSELKQLEQDLALAKTKLDARKAFLKGLKETWNNPETGEIVNPPANKYTESVVVTLK